MAEQQSVEIQLMREVIASRRNDSKWLNAPLGDVKVLSNTHIGDVGQDFVQKWCAHLGLDWAGSGSRQSSWDARIEGVTFEIKTATEDIHRSFQFNHIRHHREYQALLCLGIAPDTILFDAWRKGDVSEGRAGHLVTMDRGSSATFKLTKRRTALRSLGEFEDRIAEIVAELSGV